MTKSHRVGYRGMLLSGAVKAAPEKSPKVAGVREHAAKRNVNVRFTASSFLILRFPFMDRRDGRFSEEAGGQRTVPCLLSISLSALNLFQFIFPASEAEFGCGFDRMNAVAGFHTFDEMGLPGIVGGCVD